MRIHVWATGAVVAAVSCVPAVCHAQSVPFTHEGFYLQMSLGGGYLGTSGSAHGEDLRLRGGAVSGSCWVGGSLVPGFVLGAGTLSSVAIHPSVKETVQGTEIDLSGASPGLTLNMIGLVSDFYPDPKKGLHFQAMLGYAVVAITQSSSTSQSPSGVGLMGGVGYDFWVSEEWSIGALGSFAYAASKLNGVGYPTLAPALVASFTYN